jgi:signal transduction histidine kinase/GAF domain-containing protein
MEAKAQTPTLKESTIVERVARIVSSVRGVNPDYTRLAAELEPAIPFDVFGVILLRHDRQAVRVTVCQRDGSTWLAQYHQHPLVDSKLAQILPSPSTVVSNYPNGLDGPPALCGDALSNAHQLHSTLIAPLIVGDRVLGTLELGSTLLDTYADPTLQRLIDAVVRVLAAAIESAQVGGSAEIQDRQRQALKDVSSALTSKVDLSTILDQIVVGVATALHVASAILIYDQREGRLHVAAQSGLNPLVLRKIAAGKGATSEQSIIGYTLRRRQPLFSNDISTDERFPLSRAFSAELGIHSFFSYPLVTGTTVYGALLLCSSEAGGFTPLKADILSLFASQATIAIHNGMLLASAHQRSRFQQAIEQLEQAYQQNTDEQEVLARVRHESEHTFGVSFTSLLHFISDHLLTRSERDLHAVFHPVSASPESEPPLSPSLDALLSEEYLPQASPAEEYLHSFHQNKSPSHDDGVVLLTQTAEAALARAEVLSELGRLFTQLNLSSEQRKDAWFVVDLLGICIYMNPSADAFCGMRLGTATESTLEDMFTDLLPRIRNADEVRTYLHDLSHGNVFRQDMRCVLAIEPLHGRPGSAASHYPTFAADVESLLAGLQPSRTSLRLESAPSDYHYRLSHYPLVNQRGLHIAHVLQVHDVTEQVRDEKNKSALLSSVSHDLRTPLTTIKAAVTGLLQEGVAWDEQTRREILEDIDTETEHLSILINSLVEMSRIEMGALVLDKEWCDALEILHGALARLERARAGRSIRTIIQPNLPLIYADHVQLERVFYNLIENAIRHSPDHAEILVSLDIVDESTTEAPLQSLRARIIDSGNGIMIHERDHIFKTFYGLNLRGNGLALAICRGIIEAHHGHIGVEAAPGNAGSCFFFTLPIHSYNATPLSSAARSNSTSPSARTDTSLEATHASSSLPIASHTSPVAVRPVAPSTEEQL